ncbi:alpha/beta hydrolase [Microbacterium sp. OR21]|uniref:alpha/beta hydrolase n=1 Tax=Microbacterium sp. OR21 TaxID=3095346 RepID=UPI0039B65CC6
MCGSSKSWGAVTDRLIDSGYRVLAVDLPGHGLSPRDEATSVSAAADAVVETVRTSLSGPLTVAMGHSYGGSVLAAAVGRLRPTTAVYVDAGMLIRGGQDREALIEQYENDRRLRSRGGCCGSHSSRCARARDPRRSTYRLVQPPPRVRGCSSRSLHRLRVDRPHSVVRRVVVRC